jgi:hypothetical protein
MCLVNECDRITTVTLLKARTISIHISTRNKRSDYRVLKLEDLPSQWQQIGTEKLEKLF